VPWREATGTGKTRNQFRQDQSIYLISSKVVSVDHFYFCKNKKKRREERRGEEGI
jgi:hypothetical protein